MRGGVLALIYIVTSVYIGVNQYMDMGHLSMTFKVVTGIAFVLFMLLNLKLQNPQNHTWGGGLALGAGILTCFIIFQTIVFSALSPLFIYLDKLPMWNVLLGYVAIIFIIRLMFKHLLLDSHRPLKDF